VHVHTHVPMCAYVERERLCVCISFSSCPNTKQAMSRAFFSCKPNKQAAASWLFNPSAQQPGCARDHVPTICCCSSICSRGSYVAEHAPIVSPPRVAYMASMAHDKVEDVEGVRVPSSSSDDTVRQVLMLLVRVLALLAKDTYTSS